MRLYNIWLNALLTTARLDYSGTRVYNSGQYAQRGLFELFSCLLYELPSYLYRLIKYIKVFQNDSYIQDNIMLPAEPSRKNIDHVAGFEPQRESPASVNQRSQVRTPP